LAAVRHRPENRVTWVVRRELEAESFSLRPRPLCWALVCHSNHLGIGYPWAFEGGAAAAFAGIDFPFWKNIPYPYEIQWQTLTSGVVGQWNLFGEEDYWKQVYSRYYKELLPFAELPKLAGNLTTKFSDRIAHPFPDAYWDAMNPTDEDFATFDIPILTITGHYDGDQPGAMEYYKRHMMSASEASKGRHYLIVGPWNHSGTRTPRAEVGGLTFGDASLLDLNDLHRQWYDWTMKEGDKPEFLKERIAYFVVGANARTAHITLYHDAAHPSFLELPIVR